MPPLVVTASSTRITRYTIHGWRPTSVVTQPACERDHREPARTPPPLAGTSGLSRIVVTALAPPVPDGDSGHHRAGAHHRLEREVDDVRRWPFVGREFVETRHLPVERVGGDERTEPRDLDREAHLAVDEEPADHERAPGVSVSVASSIAASFDGWSLGEPGAGQVSDERLDDGGDAGERHRHGESEPVMVISRPFSMPDRVDGGDQEPGDDVGSDEHVDRLCRARRS